MNQKAQVWVETVIYTLIAFVLIAAVLAFARPKIQEFQDKAIIEQTIQVMNDMDTVIRSIIQGGVGNKRLIEFGMKKGTLTIDIKNDKLIYEIESRYALGDYGRQIPIGEITTLTQRKGRANLVTLTLDYSNNYDLSYGDEDLNKIINQAANPYNLAISYNGENNNGEPKINFELV